MHKNALKNLMRENNRFYRMAHTFLDPRDKITADLNVREIRDMFLNIDSSHLDKSLRLRKRLSSRPKTDISQLKADNNQELSEG
ncbi:hypothetical protein GWI33_002986 [Rhynchophorus ferrugineus]|uniref:Uncharacterized protein n=1 Tax=Rhynchophorus ferrugineus TaxID=354439 RepID=A0A834IQM5_RHYFE|nr:hypothetical protein GWI33_002986 [Rhynchophorus ferrugineus]